jgi:hypothetical protein
MQKDLGLLGRPGNPGEGSYVRHEIATHGVRLLFLTGNSEGTTAERRWVDVTDVPPVTSRLACSTRRD